MRVLGIYLLWPDIKANSAKRHFLFVFFCCMAIFHQLSSVSAHFRSAHLHLARAEVASFGGKIKKNSKNSKQRFHDGFPIGSKVDMCSGEVIGHLCEDDYHGSVYFLSAEVKTGKKVWKNNTNYLASIRTDFSQSLKIVTDWRALHPSRSERHLFRGFCTNWPIT